MSEKITLRDKIAIAAMQAIVTKINVREISVWDGSERELAIARGAYSYADAMLKVRNKED